MQVSMFHNYCKRKSCYYLEFWFLLMIAVLTGQVFLYCLHLDDDTTTHAVFWIKSNVSFSPNRSSCYIVFYSHHGPKWYINSSVVLSYCLV